MNIQNLPPMEIERESFRIITEELGDRTLDPEQAPILKRVIHTTADFDYADNLYFSPNAVALAKEAIRGGATVVTDTQMALSGINKKALARFGGEVKCFMSDEDVAAAAKAQGVTRARISMDKGAALGENVIFAVGNAPTALIRLRELIDGAQTHHRCARGLRQRGPLQGAHHRLPRALHRGPGPQGRQQRGRLHRQRSALFPGPRPGQLIRKTEP